MYSLATMCLDLIVEKFKRFHFAFTISNDETLQKNFEILQRKYSLYLLLELYNPSQFNCEIEEEYLGFFMNKHLEFLNYGWFDGNNLKATFLECILCHLPNLKKLDLTAHCYDETLNNIAKFCPKVVEIDMRYSPATDNGLKYLCRDEEGIVPCSGLKNLFIEGSRVTSKGVKYLIQNLPSLEKIDNKHVPRILYFLNKKKIPGLEGVQSCNLVELNLLNSCSLLDNTDLLKICLTVCPKLISVACNITDEKQLSLFNNSGLEKLHLNVLKTDPKINVSKFLKEIGCNIITLTLSNCIVCVNDLAASCPKVGELYIENTSFPDDNNSKPYFPCLKRCTFKNYDDTSAKKVIGIVLSSSSKLESISFIDFTLSLHIKTSILKCCENNLINKIYFQDVTVEVNFIKDVLRNCPHLKTLYIIRGSLNDQQKNDLKDFALKMMPNRPIIRIYNAKNCSDSEEESSDYFDFSEESSKSDEE